MKYTLARSGMLKAGPDTAERRQCSHSTLKAYGGSQPWHRSAMAKSCPYLSILIDELSASGQTTMKCSGINWKGQFGFFVGNFRFLSK